MQNLLSVSDMEFLRSCVFASYPTCLSNLILDYLPTFLTYKQFCNTERLYFNFQREGPAFQLGNGSCSFCWTKGAAMLRNNDFKYKFRLTRNTLWDFLVTSDARPMIESMLAMPGATEIDAWWGPPARVQRFGDLHSMWARVHIELCNQ